MIYNIQCVTVDDKDKQKLQCPRHQKKLKYFSRTKTANNSNTGLPMALSRGTHEVSFRQDKDTEPGALGSLCATVRTSESSRTAKEKNNNKLPPIGGIRTTRRSLPDDPNPSKTR